MSEFDNASNEEILDIVETRTNFNESIISESDSEQLDAAAMRQYAKLLSRLM